MKKAIFVALVSALILSGVALATQVEDQKKGSSMRGMIQEMMKGENSMEGMMEMMGQMTKMMDQCTAMMGSGESETQKTQ